jgi:hypothetical protein
VIKHQKKETRRSRDEPLVYPDDNRYGNQPRDISYLEHHHHQMLNILLFILSFRFLAAKIDIFLFSCKFFGNFFDKMKEKM